MFRVATLVCTGFWLAVFSVVAAPPDYNISGTDVRVGAEELQFDFDPSIGLDGTFYNVSAVKTSSSEYYLYAHTGWSEVACPVGSGDQVVVLKSSAPHGTGPGGVFFPANGPQTLPITTQHLAQSQLTPCTPQVMWGIGDIVPFDNSFLVTFDKSETLHDSGKFKLLLARIDVSDMASLDSPMYLFADSGPTGRIIVDPVPHVIDANSVGIFFRHVKVQLIDGEYEFSDVYQGHMIIDFATSGSSILWDQFTVSVLASDNTYKQLPSDRKINFTLGLWSAAGIEVNRFIEINGESVLFYNKRIQANVGGACPGLSGGSELAYRPVTFASNGKPLWAGTEKLVTSSDSDSPLPRRGQTGVMYPSPLDDGGDMVLYWSEDRECRGGFTELDIMSAPLRAPGAPLNFNGRIIEGYGGSLQAGSPSVSVSSDGSTLTITNNGWRKISMPYTVTADTVLEFDFRSSTQGEVQGIGFDTDNALTSSTHFQLYGSQMWGIQDYWDYAASAPDWKHYRIPVGNHFTGSQLYLTFSNDCDSPCSGASSTFSNVRLYEADQAPLSFKGRTIEGYGGSFQAGNPTVSIQDMGTTLRIEGNGWRKISFPYDVTPNTVLEYDFRSTAQGEVQGIGFDVDDGLSANTHFQVYGTQTWGIQNYRNYGPSAPGWKHYVIPVGQHFTGGKLYLTFPNDCDSPCSGAVSYYSNIRVHE